MYLDRVSLALALALSLAGTASGQIAVLQIKVVEGEGAVHAPGSRAARPLTVEVTDESGKPVAAAAVSFHVPESGPGGSFSNGLHTAVATTDNSGRATVRSLHVNRIAGRFQIRIVASKEQARAGTVSFQFVGTAAQASGRTRGKWAVVAALAGGGVIAGLVTAGRSGGGPPPAAAPQPPVLSIGAPSVSVGKP